MAAPSPERPIFLELVAEAANTHTTEVGAALTAKTAEAVSEWGDCVDLAGCDTDQAGEAVVVAKDDETALEALEDTKSWRLAIILQYYTDTGAECSQEWNEIAVIKILFTEFTLEAVCHIFHPFH